MGSLPQSECPPAEPGAAPPATILVVDDDPDAAETLAQMLELLGYRALVAYDGEAGVAMALEQRPATVILDLHMPRMGGVVACTRIRQQAGTEGIQLVALTGSNMKVDREAAELAGFDHFLLKPVMLSALIRLLPAR